MISNAHRTKHIGAMESEESGVNVKENGKSIAPAIDQDKNVGVDFENDDNAWDTVTTKKKAKKARATSNFETYTQRKLTMPITRNSITMRDPNHGKTSSMAAAQPTPAALDSNSTAQKNISDGWETVRKQNKHSGKWHGGQETQPDLNDGKAQQVSMPSKSNIRERPGVQKMQKRVTSQPLAEPDNIDFTGNLSGADRSNQDSRMLFDTRNLPLAPATNTMQQSGLFQSQMHMQQMTQGEVAPARPSAPQGQRKGKDDYLAVSLSFLDLEEDSRSKNKPIEQAWGNDDMSLFANVGTASNDSRNVAWNDTRSNFTDAARISGESSWEKPSSQMAVNQSQPIVHNQAASNHVSLPTTHEDLEETPSVAVLRDDKVREIVDTVSQMDTAYRPVFAAILFRWITQANSLGNSNLHDFAWKPMRKQSIDPLVPSQAVADIATMVYQLLVSSFPANSDQRILNAATTQFANYCSVQAQEIYKLKSWQAQNKNLTRKPWTDSLLHINFCDPSRFNLEAHEGGVAFGQTAVVMLRKTLDDLCRIYQLQNGPGGGSRIFGRLYNMVQRYETAFPLLSIDGIHTTLTEKTMLCLHQVFGVNHECFTTLYIAIYQIISFP